MDQILQRFSERLRPYVVAQMEQHYGPRWFEHRRTRAVVGTPALRGPSELPHLDCQACIKLVESYWQPVFQKTYKGDRGLLRVIRQLRNDLAHQELITDETAFFAETACRKCLQAAGLSADGFAVQRSAESLSDHLASAQSRDALLWLGLAGCSALLLLASTTAVSGQSWFQQWQWLTLALLLFAACAGVLFQELLAPRARLGIRERWFSAAGGTCLGLAMAAGYGLLLPMMVASPQLLLKLDLRFAVAVVLGGLGAAAGQRLGIRRSLVLIGVVIATMALGAGLAHLLLAQPGSAEVGAWSGNLCAYAGVSLSSTAILWRRLSGIQRWIAAVAQVSVVSLLLRVIWQ